MSSEFDPEVMRAMAKWPNVPACYGWLCLDRRGRWLIRHEPITHAGALHFLNRNYAQHTDGSWFVQNGPQRVFCALEYTPWIYRLDGAGRFLTHTGLEVFNLNGLILDDEGNLLLETEHGVGLLDDRDLSAVLDDLDIDAALGVEQPDALSLISALPAHGGSSTALRYRGLPLPLRTCAQDAIAQQFGFQPNPTEAAAP